MPKSKAEILKNIPWHKCHRIKDCEGFQKKYIQPIVDQLSNLNANETRLALHQIQNYQFIKYLLLIDELKQTTRLVLETMHNSQPQFQNQIVQQWMRKNTEIISQLPLNNDDQLNFVQNFNLEINDLYIRLGVNNHNQMNIHSLYTLLNIHFQHAFYLIGMNDYMLNSNLVLKTYHRTSKPSFKLWLAKWFLLRHTTRVLRRHIVKWYLQHQIQKPDDNLKLYLEKKRLVSKKQLKKLNQTPNKLKNN